MQFLPTLAPASIRARMEPNVGFNALVVAGLWALAVPAAQAETVNKCRVDGRTVFQSTPCPSEQAGVASAAAASGSTPPPRRAASEPARGRSGASGAPNPSGPARAASDGATVLRSRMGAM